MEEDIASYTIRAVDDSRTLNKILYVRPPENTYSVNELVALWEKKIGKTMERIYIPEEQVLKDIQGKLRLHKSRLPHNCALHIDETKVPKNASCTCTSKQIPFSNS